MRSALLRAVDDLRHTKWRLSTKLMIGLLVLAMGAIFFFSKQSEARSTEVLTQAESRLLTGLAGSVAIQVEGELMQYRRAAVQAATDPELAAYMTASPSVRAPVAGAPLRRLASALSINPDFRWLLVMDPGGHVVVSNQPDLSGQDLSARQFFTEGLTAAINGPYVSDITPSEDGRSQIMYTALPIRDGVGTLLGVAAVGMSPTHLVARVKASDLSDRHSHGMLVNQQGVILVNSANPGLNYQSLGSLDRARAEQVKRQFRLRGATSLGLDKLAGQVLGARRAGFAMARLMGGDQADVIGFAPVGGRGWAVLVAEPQSVFTTDVSSLSRAQSFNALALALIIGGMVIFVARLFESTERDSLADPLTRLANRRFLENIMLRELRRAHRSRSPVSLVFVDIDRFKRVNDTYGHRVGDEVLQELAQIMLSTVRATDVVVRFGGEEFIILLPESGRGDAEQVAGKLRQAVAERVIESTSRAGIALKCTISAGVAAYPMDCDSGEELILKADRALFHAKQNGRNRVVTVPVAEAADAFPAPLRPPPPAPVAKGL